ncbi:MAG: Pr6Pr family membrane protein, partial [Candidatus Limnocylindrus sp.]
VSNLLQHYITPVVTIVVWLVAGPRGSFPFSDTFAVFIIPIAYLAYTLIHGAVASVYPYPFFNVIKYGYASVLTLMGGVIIAGYVVALIYYGVERLRSRA